MATGSRRREVQRVVRQLQSGGERRLLERLDWSDDGWTTAGGIERAALEQLRAQRARIQTDVQALLDGAQSDFATSPLRFLGKTEAELREIVQRLGDQLIGRPKVTEFRDRNELETVRSLPPAGEIEVVSARGADEFPLPIGTPPRPTKVPRLETEELQEKATAEQGRVEIVAIRQAEEEEDLDELAKAITHRLLKNDDFRQSVRQFPESENPTKPRAESQPILAAKCVQTTPRDEDVNPGEVPPQIVERLVAGGQCDILAFFPDGSLQTVAVMESPRSTSTSSSSSVAERGPIIPRLNLNVEDEPERGGIVVESEDLATMTVERKQQDPPSSSSSNSLSTLR